MAKSLRLFSGSIAAALMHRVILTPPLQTSGCRHPPWQRQPSFACNPDLNHARSSLQSIHDVFILRLLTVTFTTAAFRTEAAYGCLKPAPTSRLRRAFLHLRHST